MAARAFALELKRRHGEHLYRAFVDLVRLHRAGQIKPEARDAHISLAFAGHADLAQRAAAFLHSQPLMQTPSAPLAPQVLQGASFSVCGSAGAVVALMATIRKHGGRVLYGRAQMMLVLDLERALLRARGELLVRAAYIDACIMAGHRVSLDPFIITVPATTPAIVHANASASHERMVEPEPELEYELDELGDEEEMQDELEHHHAVASDAVLAVAQPRVAKQLWDAESDALLGWMFAEASASVRTVLSPSAAVLHGCLTLGGASIAPDALFEVRAMLTRLHTHFLAPSPNPHEIALVIRDIQGILGQHLSLTNAPAVSAAAEAVDVALDALPLGEHPDTLRRAIGAHLTLLSDHSLLAPLASVLPPHRRVWSIYRASSTAQFAIHLANRRLLFHGSRPSSWLGIVARGLRVPAYDHHLVRTDAGMLGAAIYLAASPANAMQYSHPGVTQPRRFLLVVDAALGTTYEVTTPLPTLVAPPSGYHSVRGSGGAFKADEYAVYDTTQLLPRFLIELTDAPLVMSPSRPIVASNTPFFVSEHSSGAAAAPLTSVETEALQQTLAKLKDTDLGEAALMGGVELRLTRASVSAQVWDVTAEVTLVQEYRHTGVHASAAHFVLPLLSGAAVHSFSACVGHKQLKAVLQRAQEARETYVAETKAGRTAVLAEESEEGEAFRLSVGMVPPGVLVLVRVDFALLLKPSPAGLQLTLPSAPSAHASAPFSVSVTGETLRELKAVHCSLPCSLKRTDTCFTLSASLPSPPTAPIKLVIVTDEPTAPRLLVERSPQGTLAALLVVPAPERTSSTASHSPHVVIVVDTSISMASSPIALRLLRRTLTALFLALPQHLILQVLATDVASDSAEIDVSKQLFQGTWCVFSPKARTQALAWAASLSPNGHTSRVAPALVSVSRMLPPGTSQCSVLLVSDGHLEDTAVACAHLQRNTRIALHILALSHSAHLTALAALARSGGGRLTRVRDEGNEAAAVAEQVERLQQSAVLRDVRVHWQGPDTETDVKSVCEQANVVLHDETALHFALVRCAPLQCASLTALDMRKAHSSGTSARHQYECTVPATQANEASLLVHRLATRALVSQLRSALLPQGPKAQASEALVVAALAERVGIVSAETSFVAVEQPGAQGNAGTYDDLMATLKASADRIPYITSESTTLPMPMPAPTTGGLLVSAESSTPRRIRPEDIHFVEAPALMPPSLEKWEISQLMASGAALRDYENDVDIGIDVDIQVATEEPAFLRAQSRSGYALSSHKVVTDPDGTALRAATKSSALAQERTKMRQKHISMPVSSSPTNESRNASTSPSYDPKSPSYSPTSPHYVPTAPALQQPFAQAFALGGVRAHATVRTANVASDAPQMHHLAASITPTFAFSVKNNNNSNNNNKTFSFASAPAPAAVFGVTAASASGFGAPASSFNAPASSFGSGIGAPAFSFGAVASDLFGAPATSVGAPSGLFGAPLAMTTAKFSFGAPSASSFGSTPFGATTVKPPAGSASMLTGPAAVPPTLFGAPRLNGQSSAPPASSLFAGSSIAAISSAARGTSVGLSFSVTSEVGSGKVATLSAATTNQPFKLAPPPIPVAGPRGTGATRSQARARTRALLHRIGHMPTNLDATSMPACVLGMRAVLPPAALRRADPVLHWALSGPVNNALGGDCWLHACLALLMALPPARAAPFGDLSTSVLTPTAHLREALVHTFMRWGQDAHVMTLWRDELGAAVRLVWRLCQALGYHWGEAHPIVAAFHTLMNALNLPPNEVHCAASGAELRAYRGNAHYLVYSTTSAPLLPRCPLGYELHVFISYEPAVARRQGEILNHFVCVAPDNCASGYWIYDDLLQLGDYQGGFVPRSATCYAANMHLFIKRVPLAIFRRTDLVPCPAFPPKDTARGSFKELEVTVNFLLA